MYVLAAANTYIVGPALTAALRPATPRSWSRVLHDLCLSFQRRWEAPGDPGAEWVARVVRITALPPEFQPRVSLASGGAK